MEKKEERDTLRTSPEANKNKQGNLHEEGKKKGADNSSLNEMLQKEIRIDPGNEHHHRTDADDKIFDDDVDRSPRYEAEDDVSDTNTQGDD